MKKYLVVLVCLLFVKNVFAQDRNANWELMTLSYYSDGNISLSKTKFHNKENIQTEITSVDNNQKQVFEKHIDSLYLQYYKENKLDSNITEISSGKLLYVEFYIKPLKKNIQKETFFITISNPKSNKLIKNYYFEESSSSIRSLKYPDYIFLEKINSTSDIQVLFYAKSSNHKYSIQIDGFYSKLIKYYNKILTILPIEYENKINTTTIELLEKNIFLNAENNIIPIFSWKKYYPNLQIDTTHIFRKVVSKKINGIEFLSLEKTYLECPKMPYFKISSKHNSLLLILAPLEKDENYSCVVASGNDFIKGKKSDVFTLAKGDRIMKLKNLPIGESTFIITKMSKYESEVYIEGITILPLWYQTIVFKIICWSLLFLSFLGTGFWFYKRKQKRKLLALEKQKSQIDIQLKTVRSQLNPHFIFNALSSIQSLISKTDYEKANEYLIDFSQLLRKPLNQENIATWNLNDEIELLKTYIKLEQLRTDFQFDFKIDEHINVHTISFPAMLLQPIVENAIKHGFSTTQQGLLSIIINKKERTIIMTIKDNGTNFNPQYNEDGNGLTLTKDYIELVNKQYPHSFVSMNFDTANQTTKCIFTFKNWIDE